MTWMQRARCADPDVRHLFVDERVENVRAARRVCAGCPVREECSSYATELRVVGTIAGAPSRVRSGELAWCSGCDRSRGLHDFEGSTICRYCEYARQTA